MKPTDEAKRLQEEIALMIAEESEPVDMIINKALDAVIESMLEYSGRDSKMTYLELVNKLRP